LNKVNHDTASAERSQWKTMVKTNVVLPCIFFESKLVHTFCAQPQNIILMNCHLFSFFSFLNLLKGATKTYLLAHCVNFCRIITQNIHCCGRTFLHSVS